MDDFRIQLIATGGTLAKHRDDSSGWLVIDNTNVDTLVAGLWLADVTVDIRHLLALDSLDMTERDRVIIVDAVHAGMTDADAIVIVHGTDTLATTSALLTAERPTPAVPVVLTGAMVPFVCDGSDATQNLAQAIVACRLLAPGIHVVFHGRVLEGARVVKNRDTRTFEPAS